MPLPDIYGFLLNDFTPICMNLKPHLDFARTFIQHSRKQVLELWEAESNLEMELKQDKSPVTKLDRAIELEFREQAGKRFPGHGVFGEEFGYSGSDSEFVWVIDPIDGTQSLINRVPTFGTFLALLHNGEPVLGIIDIPVLDRTVSGAIGETVKDERGREINLLANAPYTGNDIIALGTSGSFAKNGQQEIQKKLQAAFPTCRAYYDCFGHYLLAAGGIGGLVEMNVPIWDVVATEAIVKAAGGEVVVTRQNEDLVSLRSSICGRTSVVDEIRKVIEAA